jgi:hypothetical protein
MIGPWKRNAQKIYRRAALWWRTTSTSSKGGSNDRRSIGHLDGEIVSRSQSIDVQLRAGRSRCCFLRLRVQRNHPLQWHKERQWPRNGGSFLVALFRASCCVPRPQRPVRGSNAAHRSYLNSCVFLCCLSKIIIHTYIFWKCRCRRLI